MAATPPGYIAFVVADLPDTALPAFNTVAAAKVGNVAIANPKTVLSVGQAYDYSVWSHDVTYTGTCTTSFLLTHIVAGKPKIIDGGLIKSYSCDTNTTWFWVRTGKAIPNVPGPALLTGIVKFGTTVVVSHVPVLIQ